MSFILRTWAYFCLFSKSVSSLGLIVSTQLVLRCSLTMFVATAPVVSSFLTVPSSASAEANNNAYSNITLLDLYPELKDYLWKKALTQISSTTGKSTISIPEISSYLNSYADYSSSNTNNVGQPQYNTLQNGGWSWGSDYVGDNYYGSGTNGQSGVSMVAPASIAGHGNSRDSTFDSSDSGSSYNYEKEVLKHWYPFGSPEFYDSWKFKPMPPKSHHPPPPSVGWSSVFPFWEEEEESHHASHELSKDFSCLAGLLGLKTLKTLKFAAVFKKLKMIAIFFIAFKLGVLLSPVAIPLLFPIIILVTIVKILPLILIIVLLLKILKKQVKIKKPFGKFLDGTGSLFFDDVEVVAEKVLHSDDDYIDKLSLGIQKKSSGRSKSNTAANLKKDATSTRANSKMLDK